MLRKMLVLAIIALFALTGCRESARQQTSQADVTIAVQLADSNRVGETAFTVTLTDAQGSPINGATVAVRGDMSHAGMTPVLREVTESENGVYPVPFEWTMAGEWIVTVTVTLADGSSATEEIRLDVAQ